MQIGDNMNTSRLLDIELSTNELERVSSLLKIAMEQIYYKFSDLEGLEDLEALLDIALDKLKPEIKNLDDIMNEILKQEREKK